MTGRHHLPFPIFRDCHLTTVQSLLPDAPENWSRTAMSCIMASGSFGGSWAVIIKHLGVRLLPLSLWAYVR